VYRRMGHRSGRITGIPSTSTGPSSVLSSHGARTHAVQGRCELRRASGLKGLTRVGIVKWRSLVHEVVALFIDVFELDEVVIGAGNVNKLDALPPGCRAGDNALAFAGGFLLWESAARKPSGRHHARR
jgi:hypothetical protein